VRDHGPGIPEELLERAFDPFFRPDNSRSRETGGTGLGLTIARMLAAKIGATLKLRNHPEGGLEAQVRWVNAELELLR
jgi:signal transduction histidine kinase